MVGCEIGHEHRGRQRQTDYVGRFWSNILLRFSDIILAVLKFNFAEISNVPNVLDENLVQLLVNWRICC